MSESPHIKVWAWGDAPQVLRDLSGHAGDEYYVAVVPSELTWMADAPWWEGFWTPANVGGVEYHALGDAVVIIGAHA